MRLSLLLLLLCGLGSAPAEKTNFVILLADDLGYGDLACFGNPAIKTPHLDKLAAEGIRLTHCYASFPVCSPSRATLLTGRNANRYGIRDWIPLNSGVSLPKQEVTIATLLKAAGYRTAHIGKWHCNSKMDGSEPTPGDHGFDHWMSTQNNAAPTHENPTNFIKNGRAVGKLTGNSSTLIVDESLRWIKEAPDQPFALFAWFHAPHEPVAVTEEWSGRYPDVDTPNRAIYYGSVSLIDHEVGRLLGALDDLGLRDHSFVLFTSDNGPETLNRYKTANHSYGSPGPLRGMKLHVTEAGIRVPGILRWPGKTKPGRVCEEPVVNTDLLPTLCAIADLKPPAERPLDGASLLPILDGKPIERAVPLYWQYDAAISKPWTLALRQGPWKLLSNPAMDAFALYNLVEDPAESRDLSNAERDRVTSMAAALRRRHADINPGK